MADHRRDNAPPDDVDGSPDDAEESRRERRVPSLFHVAEAERDAVGRHTHMRAAEVLVEPVHDEPALYFLAHTAGDHDDDREDDGIAGRLDHCLERIVGDVVEARHERQHDS